MKNTHFKFLALTLTTACVVTLATPNLRAQTTNAPARIKGAKLEAGGGAIKAELEKLDLTADQKPKVRAVFREQQEKFRALKEDTSLTKEERVEQFKTITQATNAKLKTILTPAQFSQWDAFTKTMREKVGQNLPDTEKTPLLPVK